MTPRRLVRIPLYVAYSIVVAAAVAEVGVRTSGFAERHIYDPIYAPFDGSPDIPYVHRPDLVRARARGLAVIDTDGLGLRTMRAGERLAPKAPGELRVAVVGDSVTFGEGVPRTEDTFTQVLEDALGRGGARVRTFNFGVSAYSVREMAATLEHRVTAVEPDVVVLAIITGDFRLSRTPGVAGGYLVHADESWLRFSFVADVLRSIHLLYLVRELQGWLGRNAPPAWPTEHEVPESYAYVRRFQELAEQRGVASLVVLLPHLRHDAWGAVPARLARDGIPYLDLTDLARDLAREQFIASRFDRHPSPLVHRRIGGALADHLRPVVEAARVHPQ